MRLFVVSFFFLLNLNTWSQVPCAGAPALNRLTASSTLVCSGNSVTLTFTNTNMFSGLVYSWNTSTVSSSTGFNTYTTTYITNSLVSPPILNPTWINVVITCTNAGQTTSIVPIFINTATNSITINTPTICAGEQATLNAISAGNINWYSTATSTTSIGSGSTFISPTLNAGTQIFYAEATNACTFAPFRFPAFVVVKVSPTISVNNATLCNNQNNYTIFPSGASTYTFSSGFIVSPSVTSIYTVSGTNSVGCISQNTLSVTRLNIPSPTISLNSGTICPNFPFTLTPSGALTYTFQGGNAVVNPSTTSQFTVLGKDANGCSATGLTTVFVHIPPVISVANGTICLGQTYTINPSGAVTYTYAGGGPVVTPTVTSYYAVIGTDANGCGTPMSQMVVVYVHTLTPIVSVNSGSICLGNTFFLTPNGANTYSYSSISNWVSPNVTTIYTITGKFFNSVCTSKATSTVEVVAIPSLIVTNERPYICPGESSTISVTGALTYTWNNSFSGNLLVVSPFTITNYTIQGVNVFGCYSSTVVTQQVNNCNKLLSTDENQNEIKVYPNPNNGNFIIELNESGKIEVINPYGKIILSEDLVDGKSAVHLENFPNGLYIVNIYNKLIRKKIKVIKE